MIILLIDVLTLQSLVVDYIRFKGIFVLIVASMVMRDSEVSETFPDPTGRKPSQV